MREAAAAFQLDLDVALNGVRVQVAVRRAAPSDWRWSVRLSRVDVCGMCLRELAAGRECGQLAGHMPNERLAWEAALAGREELWLALCNQQEAASHGGENETEAGAEG